MLNKQNTLEDFSITDPKERERVFGQNDHVRIYGLDKKDRLEAAGFTVHVDNYVNDNFTQAEQKRYGFDVSEQIWLCSKLEKKREI